MKHVGITFGCYIPLHKGHQLLIDAAWNENIAVIIAVCGSSHDRGKNFIPFEDRIKLIRYKYGGPKVTIVTLDDDALGMDGTFTLHNWKVWSNELFRQANRNKDDPNTLYTWYVGEKAYADKLTEAHPNHEVKIINRSIGDYGDLSGTNIRKNSTEYKYYIDPIFKAYLLGGKIA